MNIHFYHKITKFYPYRTALLESTSLIIDVDENFHKYLKRKLAQYGYEIDNHIVFQTEDGITYRYSDNQLLVGQGVVEGYY